MREARRACQERTASADNTPPCGLKRQAVGALALDAEQHSRVWWRGGRIHRVHPELVDARGLRRRRLDVLLAHRSPLVKPAAVWSHWRRGGGNFSRNGSWRPRTPHEHGGGPPAPAVGQVPADVRGNARGLRSLPRADAALPATRRRCSAPDAADQGIIPTQRSPSRRAPQPAAGAHPRCARPQVRPVPPRQTRGCQRPHGDGARRLPALSLSIADAHAARGRAALAWRLRTRLTGDADAAVLGKLRSLRGGCGLSPRAGTPPAGVRSLSSTG